MPDITEKLARLKSILEACGSVLVAYSGGVDSTLLARVAQEVLGEQMLAVTAISSLYPDSETEAALRLAEELGFRHLTISSVELDSKVFHDNPPDRCYHCKKELFSKFKSIAQEYNLACVIDGSNDDDQFDFRPGTLALGELGIRSPLKEVGLTKAELRQLSRIYQLPTWNKPSYACLASRFPYGEPITKEKLIMVGKAEDYLHQLGFGQLRVRQHGQMARIEVLPEQLQKIIFCATDITATLKTLGFTYVTLDLEGYRTGSMNEVLEKGVY